MTRGTTGTVRGAAHILALGTPAEVVIGRSIHSLDGYLASDVTDDPFLAAGLPDGWEGAEGWRDEMLDLVRDRIRPAFAMYRDVLRDEIAPHARPDDRAGWCWLPDGDALYARQILSAVPRLNERGFTLAKRKSRGSEIHFMRMK